MRLRTSIFLLLCAVATPASAQDDVAASRLTDGLYALTDAIGSRLPVSAAERRARDWVIARLRTLGLRDGHRTELQHDDDVQESAGEGIDLAERLAVRQALRALSLVERLT